MKKAALILAIVSISSLLITMFIPIIGPVASGIIAVIGIVISIIALHEVKENKRHATKEIVSITLSSLALILAVLILVLQIVFGCKMMISIQDGGSMNPYNEIKTHEKGTYNNLYGTEF